MTIGNALMFIRQGLEDNELRKQLNHASSSSELDAILIDKGLIFSDHDFEEAFYNQLFKCQEEVVADQIKEFKIWWDLLNLSLKPVTS
ncbi:hypothetical protein [Desulfospira joergensenii]|uniref:hypothetical protein n=1 Tax=Desulfospira joergensenii TaxID=53329 RepID=UPI0003B64450|nr:hypothetical protein [Desulfospira joergensenii]